MSGIGDFVLLNRELGERLYNCGTDLFVIFFKNFSRRSLITVTGAL